MKLKRLISLMLTLVMIVSIVPMSAFAQNGEGSGESQIIVEYTTTPDDDRSWTLLENTDTAPAYIDFTCTDGQFDGPVYLRIKEFKDNGTSFFDLDPSKLIFNRGEEGVIEVDTYTDTLRNIHYLKFTALKTSENDVMFIYPLSDSGEAAAAIFIRSTQAGQGGNGGNGGGGDQNSPYLVQYTHSMNGQSNWENYVHGENSGNWVFLSSDGEEAPDTAFFRFAKEAGEDLVWESVTTDNIIYANGDAEVATFEPYTAGSSSYLKVTAKKAGDVIYSFQFADGKYYSIHIAVDAENGGNGGGNGGGMPVIYYSANGTDWTEYNPGTDGNLNWMPIEHKNEENATQPVTYVKVMHNGTPWDIPDGQVNGPDGNGYMSVGGDQYKIKYQGFGDGTLDIVPDGENDWLEITAGTRNGEIQLDIVRVTKVGDDYDEWGRQVFFNVIGNEVTASTSIYKTAIIKNVTSAPAGEVLVASKTRGDVQFDNDNFVRKPNGDLYFVKDNQAVGNYDIVIGDQLYTAVITPAVNTTPLAEREMLIGQLDLTVKDLRVDSQPTEGYTYFATYHDVFSANFNFGFTRWLSSVMNYKMETVDGVRRPVVQPRYIYKIETDNENGNRVISFEENEFVEFAGGAADWFTLERLNIRDETVNEDIWVYKITPKTKTNTDSITFLQTTEFKGSFNIAIRNEDGTKQIVETFTSTVTYPTDTNLGVDSGFGVTFSEDPSMLSEGVPDSITYSNPLSSADPYVWNFYLVKANGTGVDYALYDDIDLKTFDVKLTNTENVKVLGCVTENMDGLPAIGCTLQIDPSSEVYAEEIFVSFQDYDGNTYYLYDNFTVYPEYEVANEDRTVGTVGEFIDAYNSMSSGTIYVKPGTYSFDFVHWRNNVRIVGLEENGCLPIFNGAENSTGPVITLKPAVATATENFAIYNIVVDGRGSRVGIYATQDSSLFCQNLTVQNCTIGVTNDNLAGCCLVADSVFKNNGQAVYAKYAYTRITDNVFTDNGTAIVIGANHNDNVYIKNNSFINSTNYDVENYKTTKVSATQNYYGKSTSAHREPKVVAYGTGKVFYSPYYIKMDRSLLRATLEGADVNDNIFNVPVDTTIGNGAVLDDTIFDEMHKNNGKVQVTVPIKGNKNNGNGRAATTEDEGQVIAIWNFTNENGGISADRPEATNLIVTDALSDDALAVIESTVADSGEIVQGVNFAHDGNLPGKSQVYVIKNGDVAVENFKLYYINTADGKIVPAEISNVGEATVDGVDYYVITVDHCSEYIIATASVIIENPSDDGDNDGDDDNSGDNGSSGSTSGSSSSSSSKKDKETATATPAPTTAPITAKPTTAPTANDFISAVEVEEKIGNATEAEVVFDVSKKDIVSVKAFQLIAANPDKALVFGTDQFKWTFEGSDITDASAIEGTTFKPTIRLESPNKAEIASVAGNAAESFTNIYFEHHGKLPGKAKVEVFVGKADAGTTKHLYYYNTTEKAFEFIETITITADGWACFGITHCSDYILSDTLLDESIVIKTETQTQPETPVVDTPAETPAQQKDGMGALPIILVAVVVVAVVAILLKKKKTE